MFILKKIIQWEYIVIVFLILFNLFNCGYSNELINSTNVYQSQSVRTFSIDYDNDSFLMDNKPFRFVAGSFHYFRALPETWRQKLRTMRAAGLNAVTTYVEWSLHNPKDGIYTWDGIADLVQFIKLAQQEDLYVILRPGPYICAERDMGGFPYWLLNKFPQMQLRTYDINYLREVRTWYNQLMPKMEPLLYGNGGPIIMVQVENEYGSFYACDGKYMKWLRDETSRYVKQNAVLFTNDGPDYLRCGSVEGVYATIDFGPSSEIPSYWKKLRALQPRGPLVNSEYYPGWLTHWQEPMQRRPTLAIMESLTTMLDQNASVNFYMFYGGTNFGFTSGANNGGPGRFNADVTSYDYDAPMDEAGDPTPKYMALRDVILHYMPTPNVSVPEKQKKMKLPPVLLKPVVVLLSQHAREKIGMPPINLEKPITFEQLNQYSGLVLYETDIPVFKQDPSILTVDQVKDRAMVYIDRSFIGVLSRENLVNKLPLNADSGVKLQIVVENQGRINYDVPNDFKGILGNVKINNKILYNWTMTGYPLENYTQIEQLINESSVFQKRIMNVGIPNRGFIRTGPTIFYSEFTINGTMIHDTYLDPSGWGKGIAFINGFNLGRYWPVVGPQITLYVPKEILVTGINKLVLLEYQKAPDSGTVHFSNYARLDGV